MWRPIWSAANLRWPTGGRLQRDLGAGRRHWRRDVLRPGAGKLPTASAVVADVMDAAKHINTRKYISWAEGGPDAVFSADTVASRWYAARRPGEAEIREKLPDVTFLHRQGADGSECAFLTAHLPARRWRSG